jgi:hypothetical protein
VSNNEPCDMQQSLPMVTGSKLSIQTCSPIQQSLPMESFQGNLILMQGLNLTPIPIFAPNSFNKYVLRDEGKGKGDLKKIILIKYQTICVGFDAPIEMVTLYVLSLT